MAQKVEVMSEMVPTGSKYTDDQRIEAAMHYSITGSWLKVEELTGIPDSTVAEWKDQEWWVELIGTLRDEKAEEHRATYVRLVDASQARALELIPSMTDAKAAIVMAGIATDKVRVHDGMPTSITASQDNKTMLEACKELSRTMRDHGVVSTQHQVNRPDK